MGCSEAVVKEVLKFLCWEKSSLPQLCRAPLLALWVAPNAGQYRRGGRQVAMARRTTEHEAPENPDLWTLSRAAAYLRLSQRDLLQLLRQGALRYVRRGLRTRIHREEVERYREQQVRLGGS
jgi:excisionase family DNA binding protein